MLKDTLYWLSTVLLALTLILGLSLLKGAEAKYTGPPSPFAEWFKTQRIPNTPNLCCDESDGFRTDFEIRGSTYWVPIRGTWYAVPDNVVLHNSKNPTGSAVVWFITAEDDIPYIRCFAPGMEI